MSRILIVDDEFLIRYTLEEGLRDRGHETWSAETVEEALKLCAGNQTKAAALLGITRFSMKRKLERKEELQ